MRRFVDLHTHSAASDGSLAPADIVRTAEKAKLAAVALTDHDTTAGLAEAANAAADFPDLTFIPGIEISARFSGGLLHILGLGVDTDSPQLIEMLTGLQTARQQRNPKIIARLHELGIEITMADVEAAAKAMRRGQSGDIIGRLHIAEALRRIGAVSNLRQAFSRYIADDGPAYVDKECLSPGQAIEAIAAAGGVAVLAHPVHLGCDNSAQLERIVREFKERGMAGIECYHSDHSNKQTRLYLDLARKYSLTPTGGSDFHGSPKPDVSIGRPRVPLSVLTGPLAEMIGHSE